MKHRTRPAAKVGTIVLGLIAAMLIGWWGHANIGTEPAADTVQPSFPCTEDEMYGRWDGYPDQAVCIHWEKIQAAVKGEPYTPGFGVRVP